MIYNNKVDALIDLKQQQQQMDALVDLSPTIDVLVDNETTKTDVLVDSAKRKKRRRRRRKKDVLVDVEYIYRKQN